MDAFAVAVCKGLALKAAKPRNMVIIGLWFGGFQALMPLLGYLVGIQFRDSITAFDHWIAFVLLGMIREAVSKKDGCEDCGEADASLSFRSMLPLALATSIDALAVGVSFAFLQVDIVPAVSFIGVITFLLSALGLKLGSLFGVRYKSRAELIGGIILILIGLKILLEHLGVLG